MYEPQILEFCIKHKITVEQYFILWMIASKDWQKSSADSIVKQYLLALRDNSFSGPINDEVYEDLVKRGLLINLNPPGKSSLQNFVVSDISKEFMIDEDDAMELWNTYPAAFPLSDGGSFIARAGGDPDMLMELYRRKIKYSPETHKFVMQQLRRYIKLVETGQTHGKKISDWIAEETWNAIAEMKDKREGGNFVKHI